MSPQIVGDADEALRSRLAADLRGGLARAHLAVIEAPTGTPDLCDPACLAALRASTHGDYLLRSTVAVNDRDYQIHLELVDLRTGARLADSDTTCELCGLRELGTVVTDQSALLRTKIEGLKRPPPALVVTTEPSSAMVAIDGVAIGAAPLEQTLAAGKHHVRASLTGYVAEQRELELVPGVRETLHLSLRRSPEALKLRTVGFAALFTGIPATGAGVGLLAIAGHDYRRRCAGDNIDDEGDCRYVYTTRDGGVGLLVAGALLTVVGAVLLTRTRDRGRGRRLRPALAPTGAGLVGRF